MCRAGGGRLRPACAWPPEAPARRRGRTRAVTSAIVMICIWPAPAQAAAADAASNSSFRRRGYDSDFDLFMSKMFSDMPQGSATIAIQKQGPNMGYWPYWYGYSFMKGNLNTQSMPMGEVTQDWDYGLDGASGKDMWGANKKVLLGGDGGQLGIAAALLDDADAVDGRRPATDLNKGPTGVLGPPPEDYTDASLEIYRKRTFDCQYCSSEDQAVGQVCAVDKHNNIMEMDRCAFVKANCLHGMAYFTTWYAGQYVQWWFPVADEWIRFSVRGQDGKAYVLLSENIDRSGMMGWDFPNYVIGIDPGWSSFYSELYKNNTLVVTESIIKGIYLNHWTEYSIVWNGENGWFLLSQPRQFDYTRYNHLEYLDPSPFEIKYFSATSWWSKSTDWLLHDLVMINAGPCAMGGVQEYPEDTAEVKAAVDRNEKRFEDRMYDLKWKGVDVNGSSWKAQEGSAAEY